MPARLAYFLINDVTTFIKGLQEGHAFLNNAANTQHTRGSKYASLVPYLDYCKVLPLYSIDDDITGPGLHVPSSQPYQPHVNASCILEQTEYPYRYAMQLPTQSRKWQAVGAFTRHGCVDRKGRV